ncbi:MAG: hypothetical protein A3H93_08035 [Rhodocyclales bacterium RIFCSPLOWO2_02_FULL_63_24]|nr:MAG: hypothetical protein A2045_03170 [Rhodocyclales bacterium GWA2_65_20]OHC69321.1 MAG: hypothetical protein A3H93_08035 [Rhodocyclales bacterium RIFCSPLOWO2_02_FULL_63_24]
MGLGTVVLVHLLVLFGLVRMKLIALPAPLAVLSVSLLPPAPEIKPQPEIVPPRPKPVERRPTPTPQPIQLAAPAEAPAPAPPPIAVAPAPTVAAPPAPVAPPPAAVPTPPRFDTDYLYNPKPDYPAISRRLGEQGRVLLRVHVASDGTAADVQVQVSSGSPRLDQSALDAVRRWRFVPAKLGKEPIAAWVQVPIAFTLKD